jgi:branched-chain amino acid transport system ATP-binding protein
MTLKIDDVSKSFGGVQVLSHVTFGLTQGRIKGLIGPNGAGKTTLFNLITGFYRPDRGEITLSIEDTRHRLHELKSYQIARTGVGRTFQKPAIAWELTVFENVLLGAMMRRAKSFIIRRNVVKTWVEQCLVEGGIDPRLWHVEVSKVTISVIKKIEFARAISISPHLILFDEICSGLSHAETDDLIEIILAYNRKHKVSVLFVEHDLRAVKNVCPDVVVLNFGEILFDGRIEDAFTDQKVIESYIGESDE